MAGDYSLTAADPLRLLAIDTASDACSVAVADGEQVLARHRPAPRQQAELVLEWVHALLAEAGLSLPALDAIVFGRGPGSFTGVRLAVSVAQGLALGADRPLVAVSSLAAVAHGAHREAGARTVAAAFDARMGEVYWGVYACARGQARPLVDESVCAADVVPVPATRVDLGAGSGWAVWGPALTARCPVPAVRTDLLPDARDLIALARPQVAAGALLDPAAALPVYLRERVTRPPAAAPER